MSPIASPLARYAVAIGATALAVALRAALTPFWGEHLPLITFYPAIVLSAWLGGFGPGLLCTLLSTAVAGFLWPLRTGDHLADVAGLCLFVAIGLLISALTRALHRARERLAENVHALEEEASTREKSEELQARLAAIVQSSDDAIVSKTLEGIITSWNAAAARIFGYTAEEVIGRSITIIIPADRLEEEARVLAAIRRGETIDHFETIRVRKDGTMVPISLTVSPVRNPTGEITGVSKIARDISARRELEQERAALLAREHAARQEAEAANRAKDEFLAMLGHELRNPLGAVSNAIYVLERAGSPSDATASAREIITRQMRHLARLVDDLLDVSRVLSGKITLDMKTLDLSEAAERALSTLRESGRLERHAVTFDGSPLWIHGDATRIEQIAVNLLTNALKFTPAGGSVRVQVSREGSAAVLRVSDDGVGISPALIPGVFDLFVQGPAPLDRQQGGLGIGLTLVKRLAEMHHGTVEAKSEGANRGTTMIVRFPTVATPVTEALGPASLEQEPKRVLIIEDNDDAREMLRTMLELWHHEVREASDGSRGLEIAHEFRPDVALIDVGLPGIDGYEVARRLRASPASRGLRLIALTGYGLPKDAQRAREAGFDAHLVKPTHPDRLAAMLAGKPGEPQGPEP
jgi:PAS domain S-box-containing protein